MLYYALYSYLFYAVGAAFNAFFLPYVAIVGLALYALLGSVPLLASHPAAPQAVGRTARVAGTTYLLLVATGLGLLWTGMASSYLFTGAVPAPIVASGHPTGVVFAIDLVFLVPPMVVGAVGLLGRRAFGSLVAVIMCLSGNHLHRKPRRSEHRGALSRERVRCGAAAVGGPHPSWRRHIGPTGSGDPMGNAAATGGR